MSNKDNELVENNDAWFPPYKGMAKTIFDWGLNNGYNFVDSEIQDLIASLQNQPQVDNKSLVHYVAKAIADAIGNGMSEKYETHAQAAIAAIQNQQGSVNQQMLEALKFYADNFQDGGLQAQQAIANAESSKPDHIAEGGKMVDPRDAIIQKLKEGLGMIADTDNWRKDGANEKGEKMWEWDGFTSILTIAQQTLAEIEQMEGNND